MCIRDSVNVVKTKILLIFILLSSLVFIFVLVLVSSTIIQNVFVIFVIVFVVDEKNTAWRSGGALWAPVGWSVVEPRPPAIFSYIQIKFQLVTALQRQRTQHQAHHQPGTKTIMLHAPFCQKYKMLTHMLYKVSIWPWNRVHKSKAQPQTDKHITTVLTCWGENTMLLQLYH